MLRFYLSCGTVFYEWFFSNAMRGSGIFLICTVSAVGVDFAMFDALVHSGGLAAGPLMTAIGIWAIPATILLCSGLRGAKRHAQAIRSDFVGLIVIEDVDALSNPFVFDRWLCRLCRTEGTRSEALLALLPAHRLGLLPPTIERLWWIFMKRYLPRTVQTVIMNNE